MLLLKFWGERGGGVCGPRHPYLCMHPCNTPNMSLCLITNHRLCHCCRCCSAFLLSTSPLYPDCVNVVDNAQRYPALSLLVHCQLSSLTVLVLFRVFLLSIFPPVPLFDMLSQAFSACVSTPILCMYCHPFNTYHIL